MILLAAIAVLALSSSSGSPGLCRDFENKVEPDARIVESDLGRREAAGAAHKLKSMIESGSVTDEHQFGALNQAKIVHGHILLRQAMSDLEEFGAASAESEGSVQSFCTWLGTEGFWHD